MRFLAFLLLYLVSLIIKLQKAILLLKFLVVVFTHEINKEEEDHSFLMSVFSVQFISVLKYTVELCMVVGR